MGSSSVGTALVPSAESVMMARYVVRTVGF